MKHELGYTTHLCAVVDLQIRRKRYGGCLVMFVLSESSVK